VGAKRVVLDTIEVIFGAFGNDTIVRSELIRLVRWLDDRDVTVLLTGERGSQGGDGLTRHGIEEYVTDCVIVLDHRVTAEISTRRLRVVKYRGSAHGTNEYPFLISARGFTVLPITAVALDYAASEERISTGIPRLDHMLGGGMFRGSTLMVSGAAGTGKTSVGASVVDSACARGERALMVLLEESPDQVVRNMRSLGLDLRPWVEAGLLRIWAARPSAFGLETHLAILAGLIEEEKPSVAVLDGITSLSNGILTTELASSVARQIDLLKSRGITSVITALGQGEDVNAMSVSAMVDTWLQLRNIEANGERNRLLFVLKSRGTAHSNQVRELILSDSGVTMSDTYTAGGEVLMGTLRWQKESAERSATEAAEVAGKLNLVKLNAEEAVLEVRVKSLQTELMAKQVEKTLLARTKQSRERELSRGRTRMRELRGADAAIPGLKVSKQ
jgi:circadian clock protein KaiC